MSAINSQINDSVTTTLADVLGNAPAQAFGMLDTIMAETVGMMMHNAVSAQQNAQMVGNAAVTATCAKMLQVQTTVTSKSPPKPPPFSPPPFSPPSGLGNSVRQQGDVAKAAIQNLAADLEASSAEEKQARAMLQELADVAKTDADKGK